MDSTYFLEKNLNKYFNLTSFRVGQREIIADVMEGKDVLGILPTGSGKSLCYQLPARLLPGTTIVVSPLIALMVDQVKQLKAKRFKAVIALNSFMEPGKRRQIYRHLDKYKLIYVSPELLQSNELLNYLRRIEVSLFVIDEAHCISQWGHEFRPDYLRLHRIINELSNPPILALSATATKAVQNDIIKSLKREQITKHVYPMDRENIAFTIKKVADNFEKLSIITRLLSSYRVPTLIYFSSRQATEDFAQTLSSELRQRRIAFYHGGMEQIDRITIQQQFMNDQLDVICCTSAFGMGIDKSNIRLVIHYHFPSQIESYIQEVGRAGRDGLASISLLLYTSNDEYLPRQIIHNELPTADLLKSTLNKLYECYINKIALPKNEEEMMTTFGLNEIQWRFLHYQFEKHDIINNNIILYNQQNWEIALAKISAFQKERLKLKEAKLAEMIHWIASKECLREQLYKGFQASYKTPLFQCCSNCGFSIADWKPTQTIIKRETMSNWENKLRKLLLVGVEDETK